MTIKPIRTIEDYNVAIAEIEQLFDIEKTAEDYDRLDVLATLIEAYEAKHYPIEAPDPISAIEYEMEKRGLSRRDLELIIGSSGRVSEILNRKRPLTMAMVRNIHKIWGISADILLKEYPLSKRTNDSQREISAPLSY